MHRYKQPSSRKIIKQKNGNDIHETNKIHLTKIQQNKQEKILNIDHKNAKQLTTLMKDSDQYHLKNVKIPVMSLAFINHFCTSTYVHQYTQCGICSGVTMINVHYLLKDDYTSINSVHLLKDDYLCICDVCHMEIMNKKQVIKKNILKSFFYIKHIFKNLYLQDLYPTVLTHYFINIYQINFNQLTYFPFVHEYKNQGVAVDYGIWRRFRLIPFPAQWL